MKRASKATLGVATLSLAVAALVSCSSGSSTQNSLTQTSTSAPAGVEDGGASPPAEPTTAAPSASGNGAPLLAAGQSLDVVEQPDGVVTTEASTVNVTLLAVESARTIRESDTGLTYTADPGTLFTCVELKIKNTGTTDADTYPFASPQWTGVDGRVQGPQIDPNACNGLDSKANTTDLNSQPHPKPGQYVIGTTGYSTSASTPGTLDFTDRSGALMFSVRCPEPQ